MTGGGVACVPGWSSHGQGLQLAIQYFKDELMIGDTLGQSQVIWLKSDEASGGVALNTAPSSRPSSKSAGGK